MGESNGAGSSTGTGRNDLAAFLGSDYGEGATLFAVQPISNCPHLGEVVGVPASGLDIKAPCSVCANVGENWTCLTCYSVGCGRFLAGHAVVHGENADHHLALSFADLSVWCYACDSYVHEERLIPAKSAAHESKFGIPMPH